MNKKIEVESNGYDIQLNINNSDYDFIMMLDLEEAKKFLNSLSEQIKKVEEQQTQDFIDGYFPFDPREEYDL